MDFSKLNETLGGLANIFKVHWVTNVFHQRPRVDYNDKFNLVIKPTPIHIIFSIVVNRDWSTKQLDVNNIFF